MGSDEMIKVLLVDDDEEMRQGLSDLLETQADFEVVAHASSGEEALAASRAFLPDLVVMDITMPGMGGIAATAKIRDEFPMIRVVAFSVHGAKSYQKAMASAGAAGFLVKGSSVDEIFSILRRASSETIKRQQLM